MPTISTLNVDVTSTTKSFTKGLKIATAGLAALAAGAVYAFKQFQDSEKISKQTDAVLKSTGHSAHVSAQGVTDLATAISKKAGIDDEAIQNGENLLLTFTNIRNEVGKGNDIFNQATQTITDMSVALGQDMKSSAIQVGKALNDPVKGLTALQRVGVSFDAQTTKTITNLVKQGKTMEAQKLILGELTKEFGGSAEAQATASGKASVAIGNLAEAIGGLLAPAFNFLANAITPVVEFLQANAAPAFQAVVAWFKKMWNGIQPVAQIIAGVLVPAFQAAWRAVQAHLIPGLARLYETLKPVLKVVGFVALAFGTVLVAQLALAITAISHVIDWISKIIEWIKRAIVWVKDRFVSAWDAIKGPIIAVINFIIGALNQLIRAINDVIQGLNDINGPLNMLDIGKIPNIPSIPSAGTGEGSSPVTTGSMGSHEPRARIEIHVHGDVNDAEAFRRKVSDALARELARG